MKEMKEEIKQSQQDHEELPTKTSGEGTHNEGDDLSLDKPDEENEKSKETMTGSPLVPLSDINAIMITINKGEDELNLKDNDEINRYFTKRGTLEIPKKLRDRIIKLLNKETLTEGAREIYLRYFRPPAPKTKRGMIQDLADYIVGPESTN